MASYFAQEREETDLLRVVVTFESVRMMVLVRKHCLIADLVKEAEKSYEKLCNAQMTIRTLKNSVNAILPYWYPITPLLKDGEELFAYTGRPAEVVNILKSQRFHPTRISPMETKHHGDGPSRYYDSGLSSRMGGDHSRGSGGYSRGHRAKSCEPEMFGGERQVDKERMEFSSDDGVNERGAENAWFSCDEQSMYSPTRKTQKWRIRTRKRKIDDKIKSFERREKAKKKARKARSTECGETSGGSMERVYKLDHNRRQRKPPLKTYATDTEMRYEDEALPHHGIKHHKTTIKDHDHQSSKKTRRKSESALVESSSTHANIASDSSKVRQRKGREEQHGGDAAFVVDSNVEISDDTDRASQMSNRSGKEIRRDKNEKRKSVHETSLNQHETRERQTIHQDLLIVQQDTSRSHQQLNSSQQKVRRSVAASSNLDCSRKDESMERDKSGREKERINETNKGVVTSEKRSKNSEQDNVTEKHRKSIDSTDAVRTPRNKNKKKPSSSSINVKKGVAPEHVISDFNKDLDARNTSSSVKGNKHGHNESSTKNTGGEDDRKEANIRGGRNRTDSSSSDEDMTAEEKCKQQKDKLSVNDPKEIKSSQGKASSSEDTEAKNVEKNDGHKEIIETTTKSSSKDDNEKEATKKNIKKKNMESMNVEKSSVPKKGTLNKDTSSTVDDEEETRKKAKKKRSKHKMNTESSAISNLRPNKDDSSSLIDDKKASTENKEKKKKDKDNSYTINPKSYSTPKKRSSNKGDSPPLVDHEKVGTRKKDHKEPTEETLKVAPKVKNLNRDSSSDDEERTDEKRDSVEAARTRKKADSDEGETTSMSGNKEEGGKQTSAVVDIASPISSDSSDNESISSASSWSSISDQKAKEKAMVDNKEMVNTDRRTEPASNKTTKIAAKFNEEQTRNIKQVVTKENVDSSTPDDGISEKGAEETSARSGKEKAIKHGQTTTKSKKSDENDQESSEDDDQSTDSKSVSKFKPYTQEVPKSSKETNRSSTKSAKETDNTASDDDDKVTKLKTKDKSSSKASKKTTSKTNETECVKDVPQVTEKSKGGNITVEEKEVKKLEDKTHREEYMTTRSRSKEDVKRKETPETPKKGRKETTVSESPKSSPSNAPAIAQSSEKVRRWLITNDVSATPPTPKKSNDNVLQMDSKKTKQVEGNDSQKQKIESATAMKAASQPLENNEVQGKSPDETKKRKKKKREGDPKANTDQETEATVETEFDVPVVKIHVPKRKPTPLKLPKQSKGLAALFTTDDETVQQKPAPRTAPKTTPIKPWWMRTAAPTGFLSQERSTNTRSKSTPTPTSTSKYNTRKLSSSQKSQAVELNDKEAQLLSSANLNLETIFNDENIKW